MASPISGSTASIEPSKKISAPPSHHKDIATADPGTSTHEITQGSGAL